MFGFHPTIFSIFKVFHHEVRHLLTCGWQPGARRNRDIPASTVAITVVLMQQGKLAGTVDGIITTSQPTATKPRSQI